MKNDLSYHNLTAGSGQATREVTSGKHGSATKWCKLNNDNDDNHYNYFVSV